MLRPLAVINPPGLTSSSHNQRRPSWDIFQTTATHHEAKTRLFYGCITDFTDFSTLGREFFFSREQLVIVIDLLWVLTQK